MSEIALAIDVKALAILPMLSDNLDNARAVINSASTLRSSILVNCSMCASSGLGMEDRRRRRRDGSVFSSVVGGTDAGAAAEKIISNFKLESSM